ncbi:MAG: riboflavin synthase subunit alpha [Ignavibacteria bacterium RBG_13_36_8]|nr:MAG: riboflavin synthase subunit alpha [Ignavibacteria bacterium RBG_13_36_8]
MFTGIIEEIGTISNLQSISGGKRFKIHSTKIIDDISVNDSISVNGICLTVIKVDKGGFWTDAVGETLKKTTLEKWSTNMSLNLERAVRPIERLGGHLVQGHINGIGVITQINKLGENYFFEIEVPVDLVKYIVEEGSIAIEGISLTIAKLSDTIIGISVIPHTWANTNLHTKHIGDKVNIETDVISKYIEKLLATGNKINKDKYSDDWFNKLGYK